MGEGIPKQFRMLCGQPLALYSYRFFASLPEVNEIIVVSDPSYRSMFPTSDKRLGFALPGQRRQDSVYHGLLASSETANIVCVHDAARPFIEKEPFLTLLNEARRMGAAALAVPATNTIKQVDAEQQVLRTLPRKDLWEIQTPQAIRRSLFLKAYAHAQASGLEATDDLSLIEAIQGPAVLVKSSPRNFKITTPFDWAVAEQMIVCASN